VPAAATGVPESFYAIPESECRYHRSNPEPAPLRQPGGTDMHRATELLIATALVAAAMGLLVWHWFRVQAAAATQKAAETGETTALSPGSDGSGRPERLRQLRQMRQQRFRGESWDDAVRPGGLDSFECRHELREAVCKHWSPSHWALPLRHYDPSRQLQPWPLLMKRMRDLERRTGELTRWPRAVLEEPDPAILRIEGAIPPSLAAAVLARARGGYERSLTVEYHQGRNEVSRDRTSETKFLQRLDPDDTDMVTLQLWVAWICGAHPLFLEHLQVVRYLPGQYFRLHNDHIPSPKAVVRGGQRCKTLFVYLSDATAGTAFPRLDADPDVPFTQAPPNERPRRGRVFLPRSGDALLWANMLPDASEDHRTCHEGQQLPPDGPAKFGLNVWIRTRPVPGRREWLASIGFPLVTGVASN